MDKPIGILGGTFDPVHNGHLRMAIEVMELCALDEVRLTPLHTPPHRLLPNTTPQHRLAMLSHAVKEVQGLRIDERELQRAGVSFTVDTLRSLREELGNKPLCLIMGMDAFQGLNTWHEWTSLVDLAHIIVASRPGPTAGGCARAAGRCHRPAPATSSRAGWSAQRPAVPALPHAAAGGATAKTDPWEGQAEPCPHHPKAPCVAGEPRVR